MAEVDEEQLVVESMLVCLFVLVESELLKRQGRMVEEPQGERTCWKSTLKGEMAS